MGFGKAPINYSGDNGQIKTAMDYASLSISIWMNTERQVNHTRRDSVHDGFTQHENLEAVSGKFCEFLNDVDVYYSMPAL